MKIWSAGCSTGEEVYTLRIVADQAAKAWSAREVQIVGTDISTTVIERARQGIYHERALRLVPPGLLARYFRSSGDGGYQVCEESAAAGGVSGSQPVCRSGAGRTST